jgi:histidinol dehydrogenase
MPRQHIIAKSLSDRGALILTRDMQEACAISNRIAPEHLEVSSRDPHRWEPLLKHAGAIFLGAYTSESWATIVPAPTMCCRQAVPRALAHPWVSMIFRNAAA